MSPEESYAAPGSTPRGPRKRGGRKRQPRKRQPRKRQPEQVGNRRIDNGTAGIQRRPRPDLVSEVEVYIVRADLSFLLQAAWYAARLPCGMVTDGMFGKQTVYLLVNHCDISLQEDST